MNQLMQVIVSGLTNGVVYALVGVAFALVFNASDVINFAQGQFVMVGGFSYVYAYRYLGGSVWLALVIALIVPALIAVAMYSGIIARLRRTTVLQIVMITLAVSVLLEGVMLVIAGPDPMSAPGLTHNAPLRLLGADVTPQSLWLLAALIIVGVLLWLMFTRTRLGLRMLACAVDRRAAWLCGINTRTLILVSWIVSALLAGLAGALITPLANVTYNSGLSFSLNGFAAAALGGVGRIGGAVVGGLVLGLANAFAGGYLPAGLNPFHDVVGLVILVVTLVLRPGGLFGGRIEARHTGEVVS
jgi:branched-chain amino acid transport system permease protein